MKLGKLGLAAFLAAIPVPALAQPSIRVNADVEVGDSYDSTAPGEPVESVDVFYDQISPYGMWVDEPDVGRVFIPDTAGFVPYTTGRWEYTNVGFVWVSNEPFGWATNHYGRWAFSNNYGRWYWLPDTQWGPAWVDWRQTGDEFGWAPMAPEVVVRAGWSPPIDSWHYCHHDHLLDANVSRYYEPRARVVEIHREARPIEHYATVSNVRVVVGPPAATLRAQHVNVRPVKVDAHVVGRWAPAEVHAQVAHAQEHRATFEVQNRTRIEAHPAIQAAHVKVIEAHPQIKAQVNARVQVGGTHTVEPVRPAEPTHVQPAPPAGRPTGPIEPTHGMPGHEHGAPPTPARPTPPPQHVEPPAAHPQPPVAHPQPPVEHAPPQHVEPQHAQPKPPVEHAPPPPAATQPKPVEHAPPQHVEPPHAAPAPHAEPPHAAPAPHAEPPHAAAPPAKPPATAPAPAKEHEHH